MGIALTVAWKVYFMREDVEHISQVAAGTMNGVGVAVEVTAREKVAAIRHPHPQATVTARHRIPLIMVKWSTLDFLSRKCPQ